MLRKLAVLFALAAIAVASTACNTLAGAGKDIKGAGGALEKSASKSCGSTTSISPPMVCTSRSWPAPPARTSIVMSPPMEPASADPLSWRISMSIAPCTTIGSPAAAARAAGAGPGAAQAVASATATIDAASAVGIVVIPAPEDA